MKVLIIDDSKPIMMTVKDMLVSLGHEVSHAINGDDAYISLKKNAAYDLILLDWNMPVMDGIEFLTKNKEEKIFKIPVIMMTTENQPDKIRKALSLGAVDYMMKPFTADILKQKLDMLEDLL